MAELKTKVTVASVADYIASRANEQQKADCTALMNIFRRITKQAPKMWGPSIVGYGSYQYTYESGRTGEICLAGFAIRGRELVVYLDCEESEQDTLLSKLGKHRMTKSCLYFKQLKDLDKNVLEQLVVASIERVRLRYGQSGDANPSLKRQDYSPQRQGTMSKTVQTLLEDYRLLGEEQFQIVEKVRSLANKTVKPLLEEVKYGGILFTSGVQFGGVFAYKGHVSVEFSHGARIADSEGFLEGAGKGRRHLKLRTVSDIKVKKLAAYLSLALEAAKSAA